MLSQRSWVMVPEWRPRWEQLCLDVGHGPCHGHFLPRRGSGHGTTVEHHRTFRRCRSRCGDLWETGGQVTMVTHPGRTWPAEIQYIMVIFFSNVISS